MVRISKRKWATATGQCTEAFSWSAHVLGADHHGTWLGSRRGNAVRQPDGSAEPQSHDVVWLLVEDAWYLPAFWFTADTDLTIDVCTPPTFEDGTWSLVDMELDLFRGSDGQAGVVDQDEWDLLVASGLVSDDEVRAVEETAGSLLALVERKAEPFGQAACPGSRVLAACRAEQIPPVPGHRAVGFMLRTGLPCRRQDMAANGALRTRQPTSGCAAARSTRRCSRELEARFAILPRWPTSLPRSPLTATIRPRTGLTRWLSSPTSTGSRARVESMRLA